MISITSTEVSAKKEIATCWPLPIHPTTVHQLHCHRHGINEQEYTRHPLAVPVRVRIPDQQQCRPLPTTITTATTITKAA